MSEEERKEEKQKPSYISIANSWIIIGGCALLTYPFSFCIFNTVNPFAMMGAIVFLPALVVIAFLQYYSTFRFKAEAAYSVAVLYFLGAAFSIFAMISTNVKALQNELPNIELIFWFSGISIIILIYAIISGYINIRWGRQIGKRKTTLIKQISPNNIKIAKKPWILIGVFIASFIGGGIHGISSERNPIRYTENVESVSWLPESASQISFYKSYTYTAYEFNIPEKDFLNWAKENYWNVGKIGDEPVLIRRFNYLIVRFPDSHKDFKTQESEIRVQIDEGYVYKKDWSGSGQRIVAYDSKQKRAYYQHNPR